MHKHASICSEWPVVESTPRALLSSQSVLVVVGIPMAHKTLLGFCLAVAVCCCSSFVVDNYPAPQLGPGGHVLPHEYGCMHILAPAYRKHVVVACILIRHVVTAPHASTCRVACILCCSLHFCCSLASYFHVALHPHFGITAHEFASIKPACGLGVFEGSSWG